MAPGSAMPLVSGRSQGCSRPPSDGLPDRAGRPEGRAGRHSRRSPRRAGSGRRGQQGVIDGDPGCFVHDDMGGKAVVNLVAEPGRLARAQPAAKDREVGHGASGSNGRRARRSTAGQMSAGLATTSMAPLKVDRTMPSPRHGRRGRGGAGRGPEPRPAQTGAEAILRRDQACVRPVPGSGRKAAGAAHQITSGACRWQRDSGRGNRRRWSRTGAIRRQNVWRCIRSGVSSIRSTCGRPATSGWMVKAKTP